jgi:DNA-binding CsgD family transcriptional regulator
MGSSAAYIRAHEAIGRICRGGLDPRELRLEALAAIRRAVGFDAYAWLVTDPETAVGSSPLADVPCLPRLPELIRLKYLTGVNRWTALPGAVASLAGTTGGDLSRSLMWRGLLREYQVTDIASSVYRDRFGCWGFLDLWRTGAARFTAEETGFLAEIAGPVTAALRQGVAGTFTSPGGGTAAPPAGRDEPPAGPAADWDEPPAGPVVLLLSPDLAVRAQTPQTQRYLRVLVPPEEGRAPVPAGAYNVAAQLLAAEAGTDRHPPMARVHLAAGRWLTLRAARIDTGQPGTPDIGDSGTGDIAASDIAVSIESAAAGDRVSVFARACGLSRRETELLDHLVAGADTREVARQMFVSENTVQDHLKSVFAKTATRSRRTLLARAVGS